MSPEETRFPSLAALLQLSDGISPSEEPTPPREKPHLEIIPHPDAPLFAGSDAGLVLEQAIDEIASSNLTDSAAARELLAQAGLVNLWFFLRFIASQAGPFEKLNDNLHVEMCNFRQHLLAPGARGALFLPRGVYKTTIVTEGAPGWELIRNPNLRIRITNAIEETAGDFFEVTKHLFEDNWAMKWLYPQHCTEKRESSTWNRKHIVLPSRAKYARDPSLTYGGITGSAEGHHFDLHIVDDPVGLAALNSMRQANASMYQTTNWFWASEKSLLISPRRSRVIVVGTRYAVDDIYSTIIRVTHSVEGYWMSHFKPNPKGKWEVYYRKAIEDGQVIFPEEFSLDMFEEMAENDRWTFVTQYLNAPEEAGLSELSSYTVKKCRVWQDQGGRWFVTSEAFPESTYLAALDVIIPVDPAATERYVSARTSRTAVGVIGMDWNSNVYLLDLQVDYVSPTKMFDWIFDFATKYDLYVRGTFLEANAGFKVLGPVIHKEEELRNVKLGLQTFAASGQKDARIRSDLEPLLNEGRLYVNERFYGTVMEEVLSFPLGQRKDILDMISSGVRSASRPISPEEQREQEEEEAAFFENRSRNAAGY